MAQKSESAARPRDLATLEEVATYLKVPPKTLYNWRNRGIGPPGNRVGRYVRYCWADVEKWFAEQRQGAA